MKTIGLIGGMSWESSLDYYRLINQMVQARLGGYHSARLVMVSVDFAEVEILQRAGDWEEAGRIMASAARSLVSAGAEFIVLCTNTLHQCAQDITKAVNIPFLHIADPTAETIKNAGLDIIGLLGTRYTMERDFYRGRLTTKYQLNVITPDKSDRDIVHRIIFDELVKGIVRNESRKEYLRIIQKLHLDGAQGVILGCTEIGMLLKAGDVDLPLFDTTRIHVQAAVDFALQP